MADRFRLFPGQGTFDFGALGVRPDNTRAKSRTRKTSSTASASIQGVADDDDIEPPSKQEIERSFDFGSVDRKDRENRDPSNLGPQVNYSGDNVLFGDLLDDPFNLKPEEPPGLGKKKKQGTQALRAPGSIGFGGFV